MSIKFPWILLFFLSGKAIAGLEESRLPYPPGSVYNLGKLLPWNAEEPAIIRYPTGCSVNAVADFAIQIFFPQSQGAFSQVFHAECVRHDLCYRHGSYTYQFSKTDCDDEFAKGLKLRCSKEFIGSEQRQCQRVADLLTLAARKFGHLSYHADDYRFRDYGYYFEYLDNRGGQYALLWSMLDPKSKFYRRLYRKKVNDNQPLPNGRSTRQWILRFFEKKISLQQLLKHLKNHSGASKAGPAQVNTPRFGTR